MSKRISSSPKIVSLFLANPPYSSTYLTYEIFNILYDVAKVNLIPSITKFLQTTIKLWWWTALPFIAIITSLRH